MKKTAIILTQNVEEIEAITTIDLLRRAEITVDIYGIDEKTVTGSHAIIISCEKLLNELVVAEYDGLIIPGGPGVENLLSDDRVLNLVKTFNENNKLIAAICAAPQVLGKAGIIKGYNITHFPGVTNYLDGISDKTPKPVVIDKNIITSVAAGTAVDFGLAIIQVLENNETAQKIKNQIVYDI